MGFINPLNYVIPQKEALSFIHGVLSDTAISRIIPPPVTPLHSGDYTVYSMTICYNDVEETHSYKGVERQTRSMVHSFTVYVDSDDVAVVTEDIIVACSP